LVGDFLEPPWRIFLWNLAIDAKSALIAQFGRKFIELVGVYQKKPILKSLELRVFEAAVRDGR
jgi:hypothetical protein